MSGEQKILYHYTSARGVVGIVSSQKLWLSDYRSLNDRTEIKYALDIIKSTISELSSEEYFQKFLSRIDWEDQIYDNLADSVAVCSLSEARNDPVLWRIYSPSNGYCLGMNLNILGEFAKKQGIQVGKVIYKIDDQKTYVRNSLKSFFENDSVMKGGQKLPSNIGDLDRMFGSINFFFWLYKIAPLLKHSSFEHEQEWRLFQHIRNSADLNFRVEKDIVPFIEMKLKFQTNWRVTEDEHWLSSLDFGPGDTERNFAQYSLLIQSRGFDDKKVKFHKASIPLHSAS